MKPIRSEQRLSWLHGAVFTLLVTMHAAALMAKAPDDSSPGQMTWGVGDHYKLPADAGGWSIVEPGREHRTIYAAADGHSDNTGLTPGSPVDLQTGVRMLRQGSSDWLLLRRGDVFEVGISLGGNMLGESPLRPMVVGAYGEGPRPIVRGGVGAIKHFPRGSLVIRDLHMQHRGLRWVVDDRFVNVLVENVLFDNAASAIQGGHCITVRRCVIKNVHRDTPANSDGTEGWARKQHASRESGIYANGVRALLIEECVIDHNGWQQGYVESGGMADDPQPPSMYSHNLYLSTKNRDLTVRDNINTRAASQALRDGSGLFYVGNVMIANNIGGYCGGAAGDGNFSTYADNVLIHPAAKQAPQIGGRGWGWSMADVNGSQAIRNIFAHATEGQNHLGLEGTEGVVVDGYVRYQWHQQPEVNPTREPFPDPNRTIMTYDRQHGSGTGTLDAFMAEAKAQERGNWRTQYAAPALVEYFQKGFGIWPGKRSETASAAFIAAGGDRIRWDNGRNWSTGNLPIDGDTIDIAGHEVYYSGTHEIESLTLGNGGTLRVHQGRLAIVAQRGLVAGPNGSSLYVNRSGVVDLNGVGGEGELGLFVANGRLTNRGPIDAGARVRIEATGGEVVLAGGGGSLVLGTGSQLRIVGASANVGFHATGPARIRFEGNALLAFAADETGLGSLGDCSEGNHSEAESVLEIVSPGAKLSIDLTGLDLSPGEHRLVLVKVDRLVGRFVKENIAGFDAGRIDEATVEYDEEAGEIRLLVRVAAEPLAGRPGIERTDPRKP